MKEFTEKESMKVVKNYFKDKSLYKNKGSLKEGNFFFCKYQAKDDTMTYDKTPFAVLLKKGKRHSMVLNLHWCPYQMRVLLIKFILKINKNNIKNKLPLSLEYAKIKPFLKQVGYYPIIKLYINARISQQVVVVPDSELINASKLKTETFTNGKYSAEQLFKNAIKAKTKYK